MESFSITAPHEEAAALIKGKPVVSRQVFDGLLPELKGRAFTITGVEGANVLQRVRDAVAGIAEGDTWDDAKKQIVDDLHVYLGEGAENRAELLLRTHGFQAFQAANWRVAQEDLDTTHLQYMSMEDDHVRESHAALNGIVLPKDDPFWAKHYPPWDWGCRCQAVPMNPDQVEEERVADEKKAPENRNVLSDALADQLRNGTLMREGQRFDVTPPSDSGRENAFEWHPDNLRLPVDELKDRYDAPVWAKFELWAGRNYLEDGRSVWSWLEQAPGKPSPGRAKRTTSTAKAKANPPAPTAPKEMQDFAKAMRLAGFTPEVSAEALKFPPEVSPSIARCKIDGNNTQKAHYNHNTHTVNANTDPKNWSGRPGVISHEVGHHVHFDTKTVTHFTLDPSFEAAMKTDLAALKGLEKQTPGIFHPYSITSWAEKQFGKAMSAAESEIARFCDTFGGLTKGKWGWGHSKSYYSKMNMGAMEVYANAFSAICHGDQVYEKHFPAVVKEVRASFARSK
jgi:SPP1 gp7 family putative phage head morphogenesis protein